MYYFHHRNIFPKKSFPIVLEIHALRNRVTGLLYSFPYCVLKNRNVWIDPNGLEAIGSNMKGVIRMFNK